MALTFTPPIPPQEEPNADIGFVVTKIVFGEGYTQRSGEGLNNRRQTWPLSWAGTNAEIDPIADFFDLHEGYKSFLWTPPRGPESLWVVEKYVYTPGAAGNAKLSATFQQAFAP